MESLYHNASKSSKREILRIKDGQHNDSWVKGGELYWLKFREFLDACLKHSPISPSINSPSNTKKVHKPVPLSNSEISLLDNEDDIELIDAKEAN
jgi:hypothetical protein